MSLPRTVMREVVGLFVGDQFIAAATIAVVGIVAILAKATAAPTMVTGGSLLGGCLGALAVGVWRAARPRKSPSPSISNREKER
ncbi:MAG TPA: hypothetical protein VEJ16_02085 [Alphaproteobacteria bacterium]|nr:hypothetical protein [Alphaproteobacteria bacterium]